ncbi:response regulator transcription factor [Tissierella pigra]|uniref:Response regulator transcription factor n=1 Tax=Tissierella pigra TaxID=2607614 RepID=A0A6N7XJ93_9FIRM|nr:response regulator transcription factor [Tissierella pigra]MBU5428342.1 response regulator transcription factor [Tissierella pigra]MSU01666.1 response regulator transcription factor [Tissierella pigra]
MKTIYCVEDDESIRQLVIYALKNNGFETKGFENGNDLYTELHHTIPDLILLDIMLPGDDGYKILDNIRKNHNTKDIPVIILTAKNSEFDKVKGLDMGADDYISKPFGVMELISRVNAVLRRSLKTDNKDSILSIDNLIVDENKRIVTVDNREVNLTFKEFELLLYLIRNKNMVLSRDKIMNEVWETDFEGESRTVDVHVRTLRLKLGDAGKIIQTIRNVGYKIGG